MRIVGSNNGRNTGSRQGEKSVSVLISAFNNSNKPAGLKEKKNKKIVTDLWSSISLISEIGSLKKTGRGPPSSGKREQIVVFSTSEQMPN